MVYSKPAGVKFTKTEITVLQYRECVNAGSCSSKGVAMPYWEGKEQPDFAKYCNWKQSGRGDHPMNCIDWSQAKAVCSWAGGRLPTEDEWYAEASNGGSWDWPWGDSPEVSCDYAILGDGSKTDGCGKDRTWPVCSKTKGNSVSGMRRASQSASEPVSSGSIHATVLTTYSLPPMGKRSTPTQRNG